MREYMSVAESSKVIVNEVIGLGSSKNWNPSNPNTIDIAKSLEKHLAKFNIGYTNPKVGTWGYKKDGTRYFTTLSLMTLAKSKVGNLLSAVKK